MDDLDTTVGHSFGLEFDSVVIRSITEVSGLKLEQDVIELKQNTPDGKYVVKKLPGRPKPGEVTLTRGLTGETGFQDWVEKSQFGQMSEARRGGAIIVFDYEGNPIKRFELTAAWPKSLEVGQLKAGDTNVLTEKLTITFEEIKVVRG